MIEVQRNHTTASRDIILGNKLKVILNFDYSNPEGYNTYYEWSNEAKSLWQSYTSGEKNNNFVTLSTNEYEFFGEKYSEKYSENNPNCDENIEKNSDFSHKKMMKIPTIWIRQFIQEEFGRLITDDNYINKLIDVEWQKNKNAVYNSVRGCFVRIV